jgi:8-oxo-dGTP diphosphatase
VPLYLIRHAKAGNRHDWEGSDWTRPLTKKGRRQALHLKERLDGVAVPRVLSSPYVRCTQTVEPIAFSRDLAVEATAVLAERSSFEHVVELLEQVPDHTVLCSHGDVIPDTIAALFRRGMEVVSPVDWRKGATWVIHRTTDGFSFAEVWPPPGDDD